MRESTFSIYHRRLPHWRQLGATYFVTWRVRFPETHLDTADRLIVFQALNHFVGERYRIGAHVVMDDHVHAIVCPNSGHPLTKIIQSWKSYSAHAIQRRRGASGPFWQRETFDRIIRDREELQEKTLYILGNPSKRWPEGGPYPYVSAGSMELFSEIDDVSLARQTGP